MECFETASLSIEVGEHNFYDDENIDLIKLVETMKSCPTPPKTACPSPEDYMNKFKGDFQDIYVVTLSSKLSGSHNSAVLAKNLYKEEFNDNKNITIFDSKSASSAEVSIALKIYELASTGMEYDRVVSEVLAYAKNIKTYFVLESLDTLRKNGRLNNIQALLISVLNIKPVMGADENGEIIKIDQCRGIKKALIKMAEIAGKDLKDQDNKIAYIAHANDEERAGFVKEQLMNFGKFKDIIIISTRGISTVYANDKGIILAI
jgi:DegV family protein with EDD domain